MNTDDRWIFKEKPQVKKHVVNKICFISEYLQR